MVADFKKYERTICERLEGAVKDITCQCKQYETRMIPIPDVLKKIILPKDTDKDVYFKEDGRTYHWYLLIGDFGHVKYWYSVRDEIPLKGYKKFGGCFDKGCISPEFHTLEQLIKWLLFLKYGKVDEDLVQFIIVALKLG